MKLREYFNILFHVPEHYRKEKHLTEVANQYAREADALESTLSEVSRQLEELRSNQYPKSNTPHDFPLLRTSDFSAKERKILYELYQSKLDRYGWSLFLSAQELLGAFDEMTFYYEANQGRFEFMDGFQKLPYLLVQYEHLLGKQNFERWKKADSLFPAEECVCTDLDKTTPEYLAFEEKLYQRVIERIGLTIPSEQPQKLLEV